MVKNLNFNFWILLLVLVVFFSSSSIAYAKPSDTSDSSHSSSSGSGPTHKPTTSPSAFLSYVQSVQIEKKINSSADNYLVFKYRNLYYIHISENQFSIGNFNHESITRTSIKTSGWWLTASSLDCEPSDWAFIPWSNNNYSMLYYDSNYITYSGEVVVNFRLDQGNINFIFSSQDIEGFCTAGYFAEDTDEITPDYTEDHKTIIEKITEIPGLVVDGVVNGIKNLFIPDKDYFSNKLKSVEGKYLGILGFSVDDFEAILMGFSKETPITDINTELNIGGNMQKVNVLNSSVVVQGVNYFRPYIRGFVVLLMVFFSMNQLMHLFKINSISGSTNDTDKK